MSDPVVQSDAVKPDSIKAEPASHGSTQEAIASEATTPLAKPQATASNKVDLSIQIDAELLNQIGHLTSDPSKVIEVAVRQWLRGGASRDDDLTRSLQRNPPVPPRGEWND
ncbi:MAG: hypothetical protein OHK0037_09470 [Elainellaceae cyanobacterium]